MITVKNTGKKMICASILGLMVTFKPDESKPFEVNSFEAIKDAIELFEDLKVSGYDKDEVIEEVKPVQLTKEELKKIAKEKAEAERLAKEQAKQEKAEADKLAAEQEEQARLIAEEEQARLIAEEEQARLATEAIARAEADRLAAEQLASN